MCPVAVACEPQHNALISISSVCENMRILANIMIMSVLCGCVCVRAFVQICVADCRGIAARR